MVSNIEYLLPKSRGVFLPFDALDRAVCTESGPPSTGPEPATPLLRDSTPKKDSPVDLNKEEEVEDRVGIDVLDEVLDTIPADNGPKKRGRKKGSK